MFRHIRGNRTAIFVIKKKWKDLEKSAIRRDSRVHVELYDDSSILSRAGHEESCLKSRGPSRKAKYE